MSSLKQFGLSVLNIPDELKHSMQWGVSTLKLVDPKTGRKDKAPRNPRTGEMLDVTKPDGWGTFDEACNSGYPAIGMRLTADDPYTVIDLDKSPHKEDNEFARKVYDAFDTYTEKSQSGYGVHVILKGPAEPGRRKGNVEIYSQERYIIFTGDVLKDMPIVEGGKALESLKKRLDLTENPDTLPIINYCDEKESDHQILTKMFNAANGEDVKVLYESEPLPHEDWSQKDAQLAQHICFYTRNPQQALRLFRGSKLYRGNGQKRGYENRAKYEEDYLIRRTFNRAWSLEIAREEEAKRSAEQMKELIEQNKKDEGNNETAEKFKGPLSERPLPEIEFPTGLVGDIAKYIYQTAPRPVKEVALSGALAMVAGIAGRHYNINSSGLGMYIVCLAKTGRGKEAANAGVSYLMDEITKNIPSATIFRGPSAIASGQGLIRVMAEDTDEGGMPSKFIILSEFGHTMAIICSRDATSADVRTRQVLLDMYSKNSWGSIIKESAYADKQNNTKEIRSPNLSLLGDTTPEAFFKSVNLNILNEGFLPRFFIIEYEGPRTPSNMGANRTPPTDLVTRCQVLINQVISMRDSNQCINITITPEAKQILNDFDAFCDKKINQDNVIGEAWNRSHLQALRLAGILAVGNNIFEPIVTVEEAQYAVQLTKRSVLSIEKRLGSGAFGGGEAQMEFEVRKEIRRYFEMSEQEKRDAYVAEPFIESGFMPMQHLYNTCGKTSTFADSPRGATLALKMIVDGLIMKGDLSEIDARELIKADRKVITRMGRIFTKGVSYDANWAAQVKDIDDDYFE